MEIDYIESAIAEAAEAAKVTEETSPEPEVESTEPDEGQQEEVAAESDEQPERDEFPKKAVNALARKDKKNAKLSAKLDEAYAKLREYESKSTAPAPKEEDFEGKPYGDYLNAAAKHAASLAINEQTIEQAKSQQEQLENEMREAANQAIDESAAVAEKTYPDFASAIQSLAVQDRGDGNKIIPLSPIARAAFERSDDSAAAMYAIAKEGLQTLNLLNSLPPIEAAMMVKEYEIKAKSLPKIKRVSSAPEPITSARGVASGSKSLQQSSPEEVLAFFKS